MITGRVTEHGVPQIDVRLAERVWRAVIDTGFNGDLELPMALQESMEAIPVGVVESQLAAGQTIVEDCFLVELKFDGESVVAETTFAPGDDVLIGTRLLREHRLAIDFPAGHVHLERAITR